MNVLQLCIFVHRKNSRNPRKLGFSMIPQNFVRFPMKLAKIRGKCGNNRFIVIKQKFIRRPIPHVMLASRKRGR